LGNWVKAARDARDRDADPDGLSESERAERMARMVRLRFAADPIAATHAEDADNRDARRDYVNQCMATMDEAVFPLILAPLLARRRWAKNSSIRRCSTTFAPPDGQRRHRRQPP
jgi:hypothetical protein